jgi:hypothetical protein
MYNKDYISTKNTYGTDTAERKAFSVDGASAHQHFPDYGLHLPVSGAWCRNVCSDCSELDVLFVCNDDDGTTDLKHFFLSGCTCVATERQFFQFPPITADIGRQIKLTFWRKVRIIVL